MTMLITLAKSSTWHRAIGVTCGAKRSYWKQYSRSSLLKWISVISLAQEHAVWKANMSFSCSRPTMRSQQSYGSRLSGHQRRCSRASDAPTCKTKRQAQHILACFPMLLHTDNTSPQSLARSMWEKLRNSSSSPDMKSQQQQTLSNYLPASSLNDEESTHGCGHGMPRWSAS